MIFRSIDTTAVRQGDELFPILFNCVLEKVIREWRRILADKSNTLRNQIGGYKKEKLLIHCLTFADDLAKLSEHPDIAVQQIKVLQKVAGRTGLQISFDKTEYMTNRNDAPK